MLLDFLVSCLRSISTAEVTCRNGSNSSGLAKFLSDWIRSSASTRNPRWFAGVTLRPASCSSLSISRTYPAAGETGFPLSADRPPIPAPHLALCPRPLETPNPPSPPQAKTQAGRLTPQAATPRRVSNLSTIPPIPERAFAQLKTTLPAPVECRETSNKHRGPARPNLRERALAPAVAGQSAQFAYRLACKGALRQRNTHSKVLRVFLCLPLNFLPLIGIQLN